MPTTTTKTTTTTAATRRAPATTRARRRACATRAASEPRSRALFASDDRGIVLYDGVCNLCNGAVNFALRHDRDRARGSVRFAALQSSVGRALLVEAGRDADDISSIVYVEASGTAYAKSEAILRIGRDLLGAPFGGAARVAMWAVPRVVGDWVYDRVADNRYSILGRRDECRFGDDEDDDRFLA
jgi:predicted DCC family thiol-disulfide oxidoreductase YuxK